MSSVEAQGMGVTSLVNGQHSGCKYIWTSKAVANVSISGQIVGWTGLIRVDGKTFTWMGNPFPLPTTATQLAFEYTSTRSTFLMNVAGVVEMNITFLSPVTPSDLKRQSLPFSYVDVTVASTDGKDHDVQIYTDITAGTSNLSYLPHTIRTARVNMLQPSFVHCQI